MSYHRRKRKKVAAPVSKPAIVQQEDVQQGELPVEAPAPEQQQPQPPMPGPQAPISIRYAEPDDVQRIHFFLCLVSKPVLLGPINPSKAWMEIERILNSDREFALIAEINGELVGTLGIVTPDWWYSDAEFMTDRWFFIYPALANKGIGAALMAEAALVANSIGLPLIINGKPVKKNKSVGSGVYFMTHSLANAPAQTSVH